MIRSFVAIIVLFLGVFFLPFWCQILLFIGVVFYISHKVFIIIPAIFADAWYAPSHSFSIQDNKTLLLVLGILAIYFFIAKNTRIIQKYGLEKK